MRSLGDRSADKRRSMAILEAAFRRMEQEGLPVPRGFGEILHPRGNPTPAPRVRIRVPQMSPAVSPSPSASPTPSPSPSHSLYTSDDDSGGLDVENERPASPNPEWTPATQDAADTDPREGDVSVFPAFVPRNPRNNVKRSLGRKVTATATKTARTAAVAGSLARRRRAYPNRTPEVTMVRTPAVHFQHGIVSPDTLEQKIQHMLQDVFSPVVPPKRHDMAAVLGRADSEPGATNRKTICDSLASFAERFNISFPSSYPDPVTVNHRKWYPATAERVLAQPVMVYGPERAYKSPASYAITLAALESGMNVLYFTAPNKVAPVIDTVKKLLKIGFNADKGVNIECSLPAATLYDHKIQKKSLGCRIHVCALVSPTDIVGAYKYLAECRCNNIPVVSILDEADVMTMGRGKSSLETCDVDKETKRLAVEVARSEVLMRTLIQPYSLQFLVTATQSPVFVRELSWFLPGPLPVVYLPRGATYAGVEDAIAVYDHSVTTSSKKSLNMFDPPKNPVESSEDPVLSSDGEQVPVEPEVQPECAGYLMLEDFLRSSNPSDNRVLAPSPRYRHLPPVVTRGTMFVSVTPSVKVPGGTLEICEKIVNTVAEIGTEDDVLVIAYVGEPFAFVLGLEDPVPLKKGATLESMVNWCREEFQTDFKKIIFCGFNLTTRSMTPVFSSGNELFVPMYGVINCPKTGILDALSQRFGRCFNDFGEFEKPEGFRIFLATNKNALEDITKMRKMEDEAFYDQAFAPRDFEEFKKKFKAFDYGISSKFMSKRKVAFGEHLGKPQKRPARVPPVDGGDPGVVEDFLQRFRNSLVEEGLSTAETGGVGCYMRHARKLIRENVHGDSSNRALNRVLCGPIELLTIEEGSHYGLTTLRRMRRFAGVL